MMYVIYRPRKWLGWVVQAHERLDGFTKLALALFLQINI